MTLPLVRSLSAYAASSGTGSGLIRSWPAGHAAGWMALPIIHTQNEAPTLPTGFTACPNSGVGTGTAGGPNATRITAAYRLATQVLMDANGGVMPDIQLANPGNMVGWDVVFLSDQDVSGSPFLALTGAAATVAASAINGVTLPGGDSTGTNDVLFIQIGTHAKDTAQQTFNPTAWVAGSGLANLTERLNTGTASGNGGGLAILTGEKATGGVVGATTGNLTGTTTAVQAHLTLALKGAASAATLPASTRQCGAECGTVNHFDAIIGTPPVSQSVYARNGGRAWEFAPVNNVSAVAWNISETKQVSRKYIYFRTLPNVDVELVRCAVDPTGNAPELRYRTATQDVVAAVGTLLGTPVTVVAGQWYLISLAADVSGGTRTMKLTFEGVDKGTASKAVAAGVFTQFQFGASVETPCTGSVIYDDVKIGPDTSLYPLGSPSVNTSIRAIDVTGDGTHSYNASGDFKEGDGTNIPTGATDIYTNLLGLLTSPTLRLMTGTAASTEYVEVTLGGLPTVTSVASVALLLGLMSNAAGTNKQTARIVDGATVQDVYTDVDSGGTAGKIIAKHYAKAPSGVAWTQALVNALRVRWGPGWGTIDTTPPAGLSGLVAEVDCVLTSTPTVQPIHQQNPLYTYAAGGSKSVTLTATDSDGLSASITKTISVP